MHIERKHNRKNLRCGGHLMLEGQTLDFSTRDISIGGMKIHVDAEREWQQQEPVEIFLDDLKAEGHASIVWVKPDAKGGSLIGMQFLELSPVEAIGSRLQ